MLKVQGFKVQVPKQAKPWPQDNQYFSEDLHFLSEGAWLALITKYPVGVLLSHFFWSVVLRIRSPLSRSGEANFASLWKHVLSEILHCPLLPLPEVAALPGCPSSASRSSLTLPRCGPHLSGGGRAEASLVGEGQWLMATELALEPGLSLLPASDRSITNRHLSCSLVFVFFVLGLFLCFLACSLAFEVFLDHCYPIIP